MLLSEIVKILKIKKKMTEKEEKFISSETLI